MGRNMKEQNPELINKRIKDAAQALCEDWAGHNRFSGVCMVKCKGHTVFSGAYGFASRAFKIPNKVDTKFDTASITKVFTAAAVLQLVQEKKLKLSDYITQIIDLEGTEISPDVTIEQLLNHTSGIHDDAEEEAGEEYSQLFVTSPNYAIKECRDFLKNFAYKKPNFEPGSDVRYCNCSYVLLGLAIEKITDKGYREYVTENVFRKAGMRNTAFLSMDSINENTAEGYVNLYNEDGEVVGYKKNIYCFPPMGTPDGGAYTTAEDLNLFLSAMQKKILLDDTHAKLLLTPHCPYTREKEWCGIPGLYERNGYAFEFLFLPDGKEPFCIYKDGQNDGVAARFNYYPREDISVTILSNQDCDVWEMTKQIQREIYSECYSC